MVATYNRLDGVGNLLLHVALTGIHLAERNLGNSLPTFSRVQVVFLLQFACSPLALVEVIAGTDGLSVLLYTDGNDVHVVAVNVLVLIDHIGLTAKSNLLHVLTGNVLHVRIRQPVIGMRIEGDMHHRILRAASVWNEVHEILQSFSDVHLARTVIKDAVGGKQLALVLVDLLPVVRQCAKQRVSETYLCDHFC